MNRQVDKIKEWISKEQDGLMDTQGNFACREDEGAYHVLCELELFIDSIQVEPVNITIGEPKEATGTLKELIDEANAKGSTTPELKTQGRVKAERP